MTNLPLATIYIILAIGLTAIAVSVQGLNVTVRENCVGVE